MIDLLIAGAGPAGLATALYAERAGLTAVVLDPRSGPIDKACGEGLMPPAVAALHALGVEPSGHAFRGIRYLQGGHTAEADFRRGNGLGVRRTELQAAMFDTASARGIEVIAESAGVVEQNASSVTAAGITARYLVAADGLHSPIRSQLDLALSPGRSRWGLRQHFSMEPWTDRVEVHWAAGSEAYVTPVAPDLVGVAILTDQQGSFDKGLTQFPELAIRLTGAQATTVRGAGPLRQRTTRRVSGRVLLVGDASGYVDALTGEGIAVSLACADGLVQAVASGKPEHYERIWRQRTLRYRSLTSTLLWVRRQPVLLPHLVPAASRMPRIFSAVVNQLAH